MATLWLFWPARDLNPRPPAPETNALPLDQQASLFFFFFFALIKYFCLGVVLNDTAGKKEDRLEYKPYAEALSEQIKVIEPPYTIGLFAGWGSGKSFLLQYVQSR